MWDTFPGAWYTIGIDAIMPNGRTLQVASCHHYRDQWAKAFDITYETKDATQAHVHQTTYGMSSGFLGAVVGMRGDDSRVDATRDCTDSGRDRPLVRKNATVDTVAVAHEVADRLRNAAFRVKVDDVTSTPVRSTTIGRSRASPLRLEVGPRDVEQGSVFAARRHAASTDLNGRPRKRRSHHLRRDRRRTAERELTPTWTTS